MVTTTFEKQAKLKIALPEATQEAKAQTQQQIVVSISKKGVIYLNSNELLNSQYDTIASGLKKMLANDKDKTPSVIVRADANAAHKYVVTVMDVLADLGVASISIATTPSK
jgi:biopolymer transport protein ExbD